MSNLFDFEVIKKLELYAHSSKEKDKPKELFYSHCQLTAKYRDRMIQTYGLTAIFENLLTDIAGENTGMDTQKVLDYLKQFILLHDLGKLSTAFQNHLKDSSIKASHSDKGYFLLVYKLLCHQKAKLLNNKEFILLFIVLYSIYKHHGKLNDLTEDLNESIAHGFNADTIAELLNRLEEKADTDILKVMGQPAFWQKWKNKDNKGLIKQLSTNSLSMVILLKLFHSLLIFADYAATMEYETNTEFASQVLTPTLIAEISARFHNDYMSGKNFNPIINQQRPQLLDLSLSQLAQSVAENSAHKKEALDQMRSLLNVKAEQLLEDRLKNTEDHLFFLNVPTGGGKTNLSLRLALKIMEKVPDIKKLFYVFPFINLIEQSFTSLGKFIGDENMTRLDSRYLDPTEQEEGYEETSTALFSRYVAGLLFNYPVLFSSHIRFFDLFFRNDKNSHYNFFQLANSVVIIDEIQAYKDTVWTEMSVILDRIGKFLNTYFIVMSATLPAIHTLCGSKPPYLLDDVFTEEIFNHPVFKRTSIAADKSIKAAEKEDDSSKMAEAFLEKGKGFGKILIVVNTVKGCYTLFDKIKQAAKSKKYAKEFAEHRLFLLNSTILDGKRQEIIDYCRDKAGQEPNKIILVATQSVEAGVDLDFDIGFRAYGPLDSIMQVAGRVNRENKKPRATLFVFPDANYKWVYRDDNKAIVTKEFEKDFFDSKAQPELNDFSMVNEFYNKIVTRLKTANQSQFIKNSESNIADMVNLYFKQVDSHVHLIEGDTISLFIPFDDAGKRLWREYTALYDNEFSFVNSIKIKEFRKKLVPYAVNVFNGYMPKEGKKLGNVLEQEMQYGYYYCAKWQDYYDLDMGLDQENFKKGVGGREFMFL